MNGMYSHRRQNNYRNYFSLPPSNPTFSQNAYYRYYDHRLRIQQNLLSKPIPTVKYPSFYFQHQYQTSATISDLGEPISIFDDIKSCKYSQSNAFLVPSTYSPLSPSRYPSINDERLATASTIRERLLTGIQRSMNEINEELSLIRKRASISHHIPSRLSPMANERQTSSQKSISHLNNESQIWPYKPKRIYQVIPRIASETKTISQISTPKSIDPNVSRPTLGQYHYGPEIEEIEIDENDPENSNLKSTYQEISQSKFPEVVSFDQFLRQQSDLPQNRALISVPQYVDYNEVEISQLTEDFHQNNSVDAVFAQSTTAKSLDDLISASKVNIQDYSLLIQTVPEPKIPTPIETVIDSHQATKSAQSNSTNTILSKPVKHSRISSRTSKTLSSVSQPINNSKNNIIDGTTYFFSDFGNEYDGEEDAISIDPYNFAPPTESEIVADDNISSSIRQSQTSLLNPHASQQQQQIIESNNQSIKDTEQEQIDTTIEPIATTISRSPTKKMLPMTIYDDMSTEFTTNNNNSYEQQ